MPHEFRVSCEQVALQNGRHAIDTAEVDGELVSPDARSAVEVAKAAAADVIEKFAVGRDGYVTVEIEGRVTIDEDENRTGDSLIITINRVDPPEGSSPTPSQPVEGEVDAIQGPGWTPVVEQGDEAAPGVDSFEETGIGSGVGDTPAVVVPTEPGTELGEGATTTDPATDLGHGPPPGEPEPDKPAETTEASPHTEPAEPAADVDATPAAAELAAEEGVPLEEVEGTGAEGRVTKPDVEAAAADEPQE